jgi:hypothetical protein
MVLPPLSSKVRIVIFYSALAVALWAMPRFALAQQTEPKEHPLIPAIQLARQSRDVLQQVRDYEATLIKQELINGRMVSQRIQMRIQEEPFSVYLKYDAPSPGREVLFVQGQNNNQLLVHDPGGLAALAGTLSLPIDSPQVLAENRHVVSDLGMRRMIEMVIAQWELESKYGEIDLKFYPNAKMGNASCEVIESIHPRPRKQFPYHMSRVFIEKQTRLPIRIENYAFPQQAGQPAALVEEYTYLNVKTNVGLTAADFDRQNQKYQFR